MLDDKPSEPTMQDFLDLLPGTLGDDREIINALDRLCLRFAREGRADLLKERDALRESLRWAAIWPCRREDDDDCQTHASEWPYPNEACEWATEARRLSKSEEQEGG